MFIYSPNGTAQTIRMSFNIVFSFSMNKNYGVSSFSLFSCSDLF